MPVHFINSASASAPSVTPIDPMTLTPIAGWDFSNAASVTTVSGNVSQINDPSTNARHWTQATVGFRPALVSAGQNGRDLARFDSADDRLLGTGWPTSTADPFTVILAFKTDTIANRHLMAGNAFYIYKQSGTSRWAIFGSAELASAVAADTLPHVITAVFNGASSVIRLDGTQIAAGNAGTATVTTASPPQISSSVSPNASDHYEGWMFGSVLSTPNIQGVESWLKSRWATT